jgi:D-3-phosphoglycerate dehydrogenase
LEGKTIGLYGFGSIGQRVAHRLAGFGCELIAFDPDFDHQAVDDLSVQAISKEEVISRSDILSLHCPAVSETVGMVNADFLEKMKPGSFLINTARGEIVDENALYEAIKKGRIAGVGLDVFCQQPPDPDNPLLSLSQVIATPHMGAHTDIATDNMGWGALENCLAVLRGEDPPNRII